MITLLLIDDEDSILHAFRRAFRGPEFTLHTASTAAEGLAMLATHQPDMVILDVHLPDATGLETFTRIHKADARLPVVLITGHGTTDLAIEAIKHGAYDYLLKPLELAQLRELVTRAAAISRLMTVPAVIPHGQPTPERADVLLGRCPAMQEVYKAIGRVASTDATVLVLGESGTGKELIARAIYQHSKRAGQPFLAINCAAIPEALLESELFGHEKGAFTGADRQRVGKFEQCNGGTIFLDEVGDMTPLTQTKVLRLLQEQAFERVGGAQTIRTDVRLIAATHADLEKLSTTGRFRQDLFFRLNVFPIRLPPLRERGDDLNLLVEHFLRRFAAELAKPVPTVTPEAVDVLRRYPWPGNVRELQSVVKQALLRMKSGVLTPEDLPTGVDASTPRPAPATIGFDWDAYVAERIAGGTEELYAEALGLMEREVLVRLLRHTGGNQVQTARILGITRGSLRNKIKQHNISIGRSVWSDDEGV
ncbi:MAG TPA: sigma-54 dependent transcriptional regulator [Gemmataceae bacterium]|nr:sigma-54 dependent transcriptional regulator [Gemmataceae bacterium]